MLCIEGRVALAAFTVFSLLSWYQLKILFGNYWSYKYCILTFGSSITCLLLLPYSSILKRAALLGTFFGGSLILIFIAPCPWNVFATYVAFLTFFHFSEYIMTALYNADRLSLDSFLLNHSFEYQVAAVFSWIEFCFEAWLFPKMKCYLLITLLGFLMVFCGELLRKFAMMTAKSNFTHIVQSEKNDGHALVTEGIYSWTRHPSYVGWFYWSIGTQVLLANPICIVGYAIASWKFFDERVRDEEYYLMNFFGDSYLDYMSKVPTRLPFIHGLEKYLDLLKKENAKDL